ncbi:AGE family epimerase/isomerase [Methylobacterium durans]|uniref:AGE family epimerase/isomerase n=1 Tax=Methylobacterium durans TaxID=2202825 RepID=UPI002AFDD608|nr:AGE family epimerase/isomerase [Methylobacterium durans]MEA1835049.1 AGE family epimerase/isomerase [Methylobacterium durans]
MQTKSHRGARIEVARLSAWLQTEVWPLWLEHGVDWQRGGFHEHLEPSNLRCAASFRRLRVVTRQVYSFSLAAKRGVPRAREAVETGIRFLRGQRQPDGGHPWRYDLDNRPIDDTRDLYDHAFTLLAFVSAFELLGSVDLAADARATLSFILNRLRHPVIGFHESFPHALPRRQNPHMHLLEAVLTGWRALGEEAYGDLAEELVGLFLGRLIQVEEGALPEYFDETLIPFRVSGAFQVEPGHHYEWAWLLEWYVQICECHGRAWDARIPEVRRRLLAFADTFGVSSRIGLVVSELTSDGGIKDSRFRLWPQAERIKCEASRANSDFLAGKAIAALWKMIDGAPTGLWHERLSSDGTVMAGPVPASSLYHLSCAITEAERTLSIVPNAASDLS